MATMGPINVQNTRTAICIRSCIRHPFNAFFAAALALIFTFGPAPAQAAQMTCGALVKELNARAIVPNVVISATGRTVLVTTKFGWCSEQVSIWSQRDLTPDVSRKSSPASKRSTSRKRAPTKQPDNDALAIEPAPLSMPKPAVPGLNTAAPGTKGSFITKCSLRVNNLWSAGLHEINGETYWLAKAYAIDVDSNGVMDNVGFHLRRQNKKRNITYFASGGALAGQDLPSLALDDPREINRLCFGSVNFANPFPSQTKPPPPPKKKPQIFKAPDLAAEMKQSEADAAAAGSDSTSGSKLWLALGIGFGIFVMLGAAGAVVYRRKKQRQKAELTDHFGEHGEDSDKLDL